MAGEIKFEKDSAWHRAKTVLSSNLTEVELIEQLDFNMRVFNSTDAHLAVVDKNGIIRGVNEAWQTFALQNGAGEKYGLGVGASYFVEYDPEWGNIEQAWEAYEGVKKVQQGERANFSLEYPCHIPNSEQRWFSMYVSPLHGKDGAVLVAHTNITARKLGEMRIQQSLMEMTALHSLAQQISSDCTTNRIIEASLNEISNLINPDLILFFRKSGNHLELLRSGPHDSAVNHSETPLHNIGECLCGIAASSGSPAYSINIHTDKRCSWEECKRAGVRSFAALPLLVEKQLIGVLGLASRHEVDFEKKGAFLEVLSAEIALGMKNAMLIEEAVRHAGDLEKEVAERKQAEKELLLHKENQEVLVAERTEALATANEQLKEVDRLKSMFIASMSHELRTPLNSVIGYSSILLNEWIGALNNEQKKGINSILRSGRHLLSLINDIIDVSKIEAGIIEINCTEFDLADLLTEMESSFEKNAQERGLVLTVEKPSIPMCTDRRRLLQCLINLVSNALKFTEHGSIKILAGHDRSHENLTISVSDSGIGISSEDQNNLFLAFSRIRSPSSSREPGTGLGLYLTRKICSEILRGTVTVTSQAGIGSTFVISIPANI